MKRTVGPLFLLGASAGVAVFSTVLGATAQTSPVAQTGPGPTHP
jgi:hypothetical protein